MARRLTELHSGWFHFMLQDSEAQNVDTVETHQISKGKTSCWIETPIWTGKCVKWVERMPHRSIENKMVNLQRAELKDAPKIKVRNCLHFTAATQNGSL